MRVVDSHCHLDMPQFDADRAAVVARARAAGVERFLLIGQHDAGDGLDRGLQVAAELGLPISAGVHPHEAKHADEATVARLRELARDGRIAAIGEIGLDFHYDNSPRDLQRDVFRSQLRLGRELGLPVIIHTRDADAETAEILEQEGAGATGGVIHCFTGGLELARRSLAAGFHISFSGIVCFPRAEVIQQVAREAPLDKVLVETDAPFLAPPPHRSKRNEPAFVVEVVKKVAALRGITPEALGAATVANFDRLFAVR